MNYKHILLGAAAITLASCSHDEVNNPTSNGDGHISFFVNIPKELSTKAVGDGSGITQLTAAVYNASKNNVLVESTQVDFNGTTAAVDFDLITGSEYNIVFFASNSTAMPQSGNGVYSLNLDNAELSVDYSLTSEGIQAEDYDCFYYVWKGDVDQGAVNKTIELIRPVAQINWGTSDLSSLSSAFGTNGMYIQSTLTTTPYTSVNLLSGEAQMASGQVTLPMFAIPTGETYPVSGFNYIAYQYLLMPLNGTQPQLMDFTLDVNNNGGGNTDGNTNLVLQVDNVPVQANYRTNIYGALLSGTNVFNFDLSGWSNGGIDNNLSADPVAITPKTDEEGNEYYPVTTAGNFTWMAQEVANGNNFEGANFILQNDINFTSPVTPIGSINNKFLGNFDGNGKTLYNLEITSSGNNDGTGLFGATSNPTMNSNDPMTTISNFNINGVKINSNGGMYIGAVVGSVQYTNVKNITVTGLVEIMCGNNSSNIGGVIGRIVKGEISNLVMDADEGSYISGRYKVAGLIGSTEGQVTSISDCSSNIDVTTTGTNGGYVAGIVGFAWAPTSAPLVISNCSNTGDLTQENRASNTYYIGGITGSWYNATGCKSYYINCKNTGILNSSVPQDYNLQTRNAIVGAGSNTNGFQNTAYGELYISNSMEDPGQNVASQYLGASSVLPED